MKPSFCAGCTEPTVHLVLRGVHWLCGDCDPESASAARPARLGPERGYDVPEERAPLGHTHRAFARAANRVAGPAKFGSLANGTTASASRAGFIVVRVPVRGADEKPIDASEARETLRGEPWFSELQHRGSNSRYHLAREIRGTPNVDPMEALRDAVAGRPSAKWRP